MYRVFGLGFGNIRAKKQLLAPFFPENNSSPLFFLKKKPVRSAFLFLEKSLRPPVDSSGPGTR